MRGTVAAVEDLARIEADPEAFLASPDDREAKGAPIKLLDGSFAGRLPSFQRWMWDGEFCGSIGLRWQPGTTDGMGLVFVDITTDPENTASRRVIEANGGVLIERFTKPAQFGSTPGLRYRIYGDAE